MNKFGLSNLNLLQNDMPKDYIHEIIVNTERHIADVINNLTAVTRETSKMADKQHNLAEALRAFSEDETVNSSLSETLKTCADIQTEMATINEMKHKLINVKSIDELNRFDVVCRGLKEKMKMAINARQKEVARQKHLDRVRNRTPANSQQITQAETDLEEAKSDTSRNADLLDDQTYDFKYQKITNVKTSLMNYVYAEMMCTAKALELLTKAYSCLNTVDIDGDIKAFQEKVSARKTTRHTQSMQSLTTDSESLNKQMSKSMYALNDFDSSDDECR